MAERRSRLLRLLAPVALLLTALALVLVLMSSDVSDDDDEGSAGDRSAETAPAAGTGTGDEAERAAPTRATYRVRAGDTLAGIAERTGVELEELQSLNPDLDPQTLVAGQRIKLR